MGIMASITNYMLREISDRAGLNTIRERINYNPDNYFKVKSPIEATAVTLFRSNGRRTGLIGTAATYLMLFVACGGSGSSSSPTAPNPTSNTAILQVYNTSTGQRKDMTVDTQGNRQVTLNAADLTSGLDNVVTSEFTVRQVGSDGSLGSRVVAAGSEASVSPGRYEVFIPSVAGQSVYGCIPNPQLLNSKRNFIVGVKHNPGVDTSNVPMYVFRDAVNEIDRHMVTDNERRYGSIDLIEHAVNPDLTVGFSNEEHPEFSGTFA
jgi:hypothetical protein